MGIHQKTSVSSSGEVRQRDTKVGWWAGALIVTVKGTADRNKAPLQQCQKQGDGASGRGKPQHGCRHPVQAAPPLPLPSTRLLVLPATSGDAVLYATLDLSDGGTKAVPVAQWLQTMDRLAAGATQTTQENSF
jgi:hypothetical protein